MPNKIKAFACSYCKGKFYRITKSAIAKHEVRCLYNPVRKACVSCKYLKFGYDDNGDNHSEGWKYSYCEKDREFVDGFGYHCDCHLHKPTPNPQVVDR